MSEKESGLGSIVIVDGKAPQASRSRAFVDEGIVTIEEFIAEMIASFSWRNCNIIPHLMFLITMLLSLLMLIDTSLQF